MGGSTMKIKNVVNGDNVSPVKRNRFKKVVKNYRDGYRIGTHIVVLITLAWIMVPLYIALITSFMSDLESQSAEFHWWPELGFTLEWYIKAFTSKIGGSNFVSAFINTFSMYIPSVAIGVFASAMSAYAFAKMDFKLSKPMFAILIWTMTLPQQLNVVISYLIYEQIGWLNTIYPITIPRMLGSIGIVFFLRQYYLAIPDDLLGAARVDGLGHFGIFMRIMVPISTPAMLAQFVLNFIGAYNDYTGPLLYLDDSSMWTVSLLVARYGDGGFVQYWSMRMAGGVIAMIPMVILYFISQKFINVGTAVSSSLKG
jgi:multiple sugar transport system permease protein